MGLKLEVGKRYELNNGEVHECEYSKYGMFKLNDRLYDVDGCFHGWYIDHPYSVRRLVPDTPTVGTLKELDVKPGDVVEWVSGYDERYTYPHEPKEARVWADGKLRVFGIDTNKCRAKWRIISRAKPDTDKPRTWAELTAEEKGALLLAHHEGGIIEYYRHGEWETAAGNDPGWFGGDAYRIRPAEPVRDVVTLYGGAYDDLGCIFDDTQLDDTDTHRITFTTINGNPDCDSVKMERL